jgi:hypothetical protein
MAQSLGPDVDLSEAEPAALRASSPPPPFHSDSAGVSGEKVVLWLFVILSLGTIAAFIAFYPSTRPEDRAFIVPATLRDLYIPVVAWGILTAIDAKRKGRSGWWIYLLMSPVPLVNIVLNVQWLRKWRRNPGRLLRWAL